MFFVDIFTLYAPTIKFGNTSKRDLEIEKAILHLYSEFQTYLLGPLQSPNPVTFCMDA